MTRAGKELAREVDAYLSFWSIAREPEPEYRTCCDCGDSFVPDSDAPGNYCRFCEAEWGIRVPARMGEAA